MRAHLLMPPASKSRRCGRTPAPTGRIAFDTRSDQDASSRRRNRARRCWGGKTKVSLSGMREPVVSEDEFPRAHRPPLLDPALQRPELGVGEERLLKGSGLRYCVIFRGGIAAGGRRRHRPLAPATHGRPGQRYYPQRRRLKEEAAHAQIGATSELADILGAPAPNLVRN